MAGGWRWDTGPKFWAAFAGHPVRPFIDRQFVNSTSPEMIRRVAEIMKQKECRGMVGMFSERFSEHRTC